MRINRQIEEELNKERKKNKNKVKILLLGCGEAGKVRTQGNTIISKY